MLHPSCEGRYCASSRACSILSSRLADNTRWTERRTTSSVTVLLYGWQRIEQKWDLSLVVSVRHTLDSPGDHTTDLVDYFNGLGLFFDTYVQGSYCDLMDADFSATPTPNTPTPGHVYQPCRETARPSTTTTTITNPTS
jgi:hypothetical protein